MFGPWGALAGLVGGAAAPSMIEQEMDPNAPHAADTGIGGFFGRAWNGVKRFFGGGGPSSGGAAPVGALRDRALYMMDRLVREHGWTPAAAAIAAGNAEQESGVNPAGPPGDGGISMGMMQWNHERLSALQAFAASQKKDWRDRDVQIDFLDADARSKVPNWPSQQGLAMAGAISHAYEGYGDNSTGTREANAAKWLKAYQENQASAVAGVPSASGKVPFNFRPGPSPQELNWGQGPIWDGLNSALPVGPPGGSTSKTVNSTINNTVNVTGSDPQSTAAMVGVHLDRTSNDIARNLQGAHQ